MLSKALPCTLHFQNAGIMQICLDYSDSVLYDLLCIVAGLQTKINVGMSCDVLVYTGAKQS